MNRTTFLGDKPINRMGYGAMQLAGPGVFGPPSDPAAARAVLRRAIELGVDHIDTSQYYGPDVVNDLIREALYPYPETLKLVTKVGWRRDGTGRVLPAQRPEELRAGVDASRHGATPTQVALAWLLARYDRMLLIPGTGSVAHLEENMAAADLELDESDLAELDNATQLGDPMAAARD
jgi:aryl-alcohol dehydrogenase-like predicted oxidoreductase